MGAVALFWVVTATLGCGGDPARRQPPEPALAAAADLCRPIRSWVNDLADLANATTDAVGQLGDPRERSERVLAGYDDLLAATARYQDSVAGLAITGTSDGARAADDVRNGAARALEVLGDERQEFADETDQGIEDDDLFGRMGQFLISLETTTGAAEPPVVNYEDTVFQQAVLDEPICDHVVQPFPLD
jgi:hypothetical protein